MSKFMLGDQVKVIQDDVIPFFNEKNELDFYHSDSILAECSKCVGKIGIVNTVSDGINNVGNSYSLNIKSGHGVKLAWYRDDQLELIYRPEYK
jgi:hypothetical protein